MSYYDFLENLEMIALKHDLFLHMHRANIGSGFIFYFRPSGSNICSKIIVFRTERDSPEALFKKLVDLAIEFKRHLNGRGEQE